MKKQTHDFRYSAFIKKYHIDTSIQTLKSALCWSTFGSDTASSLLGYDATNFAHLDLGIFSQASLKILSSSVKSSGQSDHQVLGHVFKPRPLSPGLLSLAGSRKSPGCAKLLPFNNYGGYCGLGVFCGLPHNHISKLCRQLLPPHGIGFCSDVHYQLWDLI